MFLKVMMGWGLNVNGGCKGDGGMCEGEGMQHM